MAVQADRHALDIEVSQPESDTFVVRCSGSIDIENAPRFREALASGLRSGRHRLVVDLSRVTFMDSAGIGAIVSVRDQLQRGARMLVRARDGRIRMLLEMAGLGSRCQVTTGASSPA